MKKRMRDFRKLAEGLFNKVIRHKDGTFSLKQRFFYRHGMDSNKWEDRVYNILKKENEKFIIIGSFEDWNAWPKDSWFVCRIKLI